MRSEEVSKPLQGTGLDVGMFTAFVLAEAMDLVGGAPRVADDARETFLMIEAEVVVGDATG